jgi:AAHS family benzoate transporter-like MFS transporter
VQVHASINKRDARRDQGVRDLFSRCCIVDTQEHKVESSQVGQILLSHPTRMADNPLVHCAVHRRKVIHLEGPRSQFLEGCRPWGAEGIVLAEVARHLQPEVKQPSDAQFVVSTTDHVAGAPVTRLFQDGRGLSTVLFWIAFFSGLFMVYALSSWLTKLMALSGYSLGSALSFVIALNVGAIIGAVGGGWLADKFRIKWVLVAMYALGGVLLYMMTLQASTEVRYLVIGAVGACTTGAQLLAYAYCGQFYPMSIRSTGIGMASGVGRLGAIAAPLLIGQIVALELPLEQNFLVIGAFGVIGAVALALISHGGLASQPIPQNA